MQDFLSIECREVAARDNGHAERGVGQQTGAQPYSLSIGCAGLVAVLTVQPQAYLRQMSSITVQFDRQDLIRNTTLAEIPLRVVLTGMR
jgi:hypothetical protein